eukprot:COSAG03_NODE_363_length_8569_cov_8.905313_3_plen_93_part_00
MGAHAGYGSSLITCDPRSSGLPLCECHYKNQEFDQTISLRGGDFCRSDDGGACGLEAGKIDRRRPQLRAQPDPGLHGSCEPGTAHALGARSP